MTDTQVKGKLSGIWTNAQAYHKVNGKFKPFIIEAVYEKLKDVNGEYILDEDGKFIWVLAGNSEEENYVSLVSSDDYILVDKNDVILTIGG